MADNAFTQPVPPFQPREDSFSVTEKILTRSVKPCRGKPYQHTCDEDIYKEVCHVIDELNGASFTYEEIRDRLEPDRTNLPAVRP